MRDMVASLVQIESEAEPEAVSKPPANIDQPPAVPRATNRPVEDTATPVAAVEATVGAVITSTQAPVATEAPQATETLEATEAPAATETPPATETPTVLPATDVPLPTSTPESEQYYVVREGDNFYAIGQRVGMPWEVIAQANGMTERSLLLPGLRLRLPTPTPSGPAVEQATDGAPAAQPTATAAPTTTTYRVQAGDSLMKIAAKYGVTWEAIAQVNGITAQTMLRVGQELVIPLSQ